MDRFSKAVIEDQEYQSACYAAGARRAERRGCPNHAATLRRRADYALRIAEDARRESEWRHQAEDDRFPV